MKTASRLLALLCLCALFSCRAEPVDYNDNTAAYLTMGQWKVRECVGDGVPAADLTAYSLQFTNDGHFTARRNGQVLEGNWDLRRHPDGQSLQLRLDDSNNELAPVSNTWSLRYSDPNELKLERSGAALHLGRP
ncbi:hypothetical protein EPD60_06915 [Flaviaesturariibacter flavus]|uniref:Lipocalin-like domain-containing protein n=1 Tax=Flaviaesturariibacter flavus TaxID=2502780 RepID=A0A4R1BIA2_9BACT|nr:hypothetical protein [Flaviaesturariibacter flavus]TCJ17035.1 hypothetical protein EPD60_06915 [Flaviaesturariibacter flavus]